MKNFKEGMEGHKRKERDAAKPDPKVPVNTAPDVLIVQPSLPAEQ